MHELFITKWKELGFDAKQLGFHSMRAGGASAAVNVGVLDCLLSDMVIADLRQQKMVM